MVKISSDYHVTKRGYYRRNPAKRGTDFLSIRRVTYYSDDTEDEEKEYWINGPPAGTIEEWKEYARKKGYKGLRIFNRKGKARIEMI